MSISIPERPKWLPIENISPLDMKHSKDVTFHFNEAVLPYLRLNFTAGCRMHFLINVTSCQHAREC